jgi:hypothetical protein
VRTAVREGKQAAPAAYDEDRFIRERDAHDHSARTLESLYAPDIERRYGRMSVD